MSEPSNQPFDETTLKRLVDTQQDDQFTANVRGMAEMLTTYYRELLGAGLSQQMAEEMLLNYHWLLVGSGMFKNGGLPPRSY